MELNIGYNLGLLLTEDLVDISRTLPEFSFYQMRSGRSQWRRGLRRRFSAARLLRLWVRIPPGAWMSVCCECCFLSGRGLCDEMIIRPEESYRLWCIVVCDTEISWKRVPWPTGGCCAKNKQKDVFSQPREVPVSFIMSVLSLCLYPLDRVLQHGSH